LKLPFVIDLMTRKAANLLKLPAGTLADGAAADVCIIDPNETWLYDAKKGFSKSLNSPWSGQKLTGRVKMTVVAGNIVYSNGKIV
jgi:dihydroorotase